MVNYYLFKVLAIAFYTFMDHYPWICVSCIDDHINNWFTVIVVRKIWYLNTAATHAYPQTGRGRKLRHQSGAWVALTPKW